MVLNLEELFRSLVLPMKNPTGSTFAAVPIPGAETHRLAKNSDAAPCLLVFQRPAADMPPPIRLQNLSVSYNVQCTIKEPSGTEEQGLFTIISCSAANPRLFPHFLKILSPLVAALGPAPTHAAVRRSITGLVELFEALTEPAKKSIQGIWAEMFVMRSSTDAAELASSWHRDPEERFDFAAGPQRVEVKSSSNRYRQHHFSLTQLAPLHSSRVVVASLFVERSGGGVSIRKVFEELRWMFNSDAQLMAQFDATFYTTLGSAWTEAMDESFDWELARESLAFFWAEDIPRVRDPIPPAVSDVRFCSDLSSIRAIDRERLVELGGIFAAACPRFTSRGV